MIEVDFVKDTTWRVVFHGVTSTFYLAILYTFLTNKYVILIERMITTWYLAVHMLFVFSRLFQDLINLTSCRNWKLNILLTKVINLLFISLIFPYAMYIPLVYWLLFYYNCNLIHPNFLEVSLASWVSTSSHSVIAFVALVEMFTTKYTYEGNYLSAIILLITFTASYAACLIGTYVQYGFWLYPVFHLFSTKTLPYVFIFLAVLLLIMFFLGKILSRIANGKRNPLINKLICSMSTAFPCRILKDVDINLEPLATEICDHEITCGSVTAPTCEEINCGGKCACDSCLQECDLCVVQCDHCTKECICSTKKFSMQDTYEIFEKENNISCAGDETTSMSYYAVKDGYRDPCGDKERVYQTYKFAVENKPRCRRIIEVEKCCPEQSKKPSKNSILNGDTEGTIKTENVDDKAENKPSRKNSTSKNNSGGVIENETSDVKAENEPADETESRLPDQNINNDSDSSINSGNISEMNSYRKSFSSEGKNTRGVYGTQGGIARQRQRKMLMQRLQKEASQNRNVPQTLCFYLEFPPESSSENWKSRKISEPPGDNNDSDGSNNSDQVELNFKINRRDKSLLDKILHRNKKLKKKNNAKLKIDSEKKCDTAKTIFIKILDNSNKHVKEKNHRHASSEYCIATENNHMNVPNSSAKATNCENYAEKNESVIKEVEGVGTCNYIYFSPTALLEKTNEQNSHNESSSAKNTYNESPEVEINVEKSKQHTCSKETPKPSTSGIDAQELISMKNEFLNLTDANPIQTYSSNKNDTVKKTIRTISKNSKLEDKPRKQSILNLIMGKSKTRDDPEKKQKIPNRNENKLLEKEYNDKNRMKDGSSITLAREREKKKKNKTPEICTAQINSDDVETNCKGKSEPNREPRSSKRQSPIGTLDKSNTSTYRKKRRTKVKSRTRSHDRKISETADSDSAKEGSRNNTARRRRKKRRSDHETKTSKVDSKNNADKNNDKSIKEFVKSVSIREREKSLIKSKPPCKMHECEKSFVESKPTCRTEPQEKCRRPAKHNIGLTSNSKKTLFERIISFSKCRPKEKDLKCRSTKIPQNYPIEPQIEAHYRILPANKNKQLPINPKAVKNLENLKNVPKSRNGVKRFKFYATVLSHLSSSSDT